MPILRHIATITNNFFSKNSTGAWLLFPSRRSTMSLSKGYADVVGSEARALMDAEKAARQAAKPFESIHDLQPLIDKISHSKVVMLGEATHGTHEFYEWRKEITKVLVKEHGFRAIAIEGEWPASRSITRYINGAKDISAKEALRKVRKKPAPSRHWCIGFA